jgi:F-type H+-transporting ATPase subunit gamma
VISTRDIKKKIQTVQSIEQICRAMKTVASIRLRRAEQRLLRSRQYREMLNDLVRQVAAVTQEHAFLRERPVETTGLVVVTSDRGLCGGYNANAVRRALAVGDPEGSAVVAIGRKGLGHMRRRGYRIIDQLVPMGGLPEAFGVAALADRLGARYEAGEIDALVLVYTEFLGGTRTELRAETVLPVRPKEVAYREAIFEPEPRQMLPGLMTRYLRTELLGAVLSASASEHAARVQAMTAATDNAEDMINGLTLDYNKARQSGITRELTELAGAAEATA